MSDTTAKIDADYVSSTSDQRTVNNVMRHEYRVLSDDEKKAIGDIKDTALAVHNQFTDLLDNVNKMANSPALDKLVALVATHAPAQSDFSHPASVANSKTEDLIGTLPWLRKFLSDAIIYNQEAAMWAVKHIST